MIRWLREMVSGTNIEGTVVGAPIATDLSPRNSVVGGRNVPVISFRFRVAHPARLSGAIVGAQYSGEIHGVISQNDWLHMRGFWRDEGAFQAVEIWLAGTLDPDSGEIVAVRPARIAHRTVRRERVLVLARPVPAAVLGA